MLERMLGQRLATILSETYSPELCGLTSTSTQGSMDQSNATNISTLTTPPMSPCSSTADNDIPPETSTAKSHTAKISVMSDAELLAYTTAATVEVLRRYAMDGSSATYKFITQSQSLKVERHAAKISVLSNAQLSACFYEATIKVLCRFASMTTIIAAQKAIPPQPRTAQANVLPSSGPELLACCMKSNINFLHIDDMRMRINNEYTTPPESSGVQSNLPIAELLAYTTAATADLLRRLETKHCSAANKVERVHTNLAHISMFSGVELIAYTSAATIEVLHRYIRALNGKTMPPQPQSKADNVLTTFRPELLACFTQDTVNFLHESLTKEHPRPEISSVRVERKDDTPSTSIVDVLPSVDIAVSKTEEEERELHVEVEPTVSSVSRKRSGETNTGDVKRRLFSRPESVQSPSIFSNPQPQSGNNQLRNLYSSLCRVLNCSACDDWMRRDDIRVCGCRIICKRCATRLTKCDNCRYKFENNTRLINFHQRIAEQIYRPCKYKRDGCIYVVKPGDQHEANCDYRHVACQRCDQYVSKAHMLDHFENVHFLATKDSDVKLADFYLEDTGLRKIKCVTSQGDSVYLLLLNLDSVDGYNHFTVVYPDTVNSIKVKLEFHMNVFYKYCRSNFKPQNSSVGEAVIKVKDTVFSDWVNEGNVLSIEVRDGKKREKSHHTL